MSTFLELLTLADRARRGHKLHCRCVECRGARELIDASASAFGKLRGAPPVDAPPVDAPPVEQRGPSRAAGGQQVVVVREVVGELVSGGPSGPSRWSR